MNLPSFHSAGAELRALTVEGQIADVAAALDLAKARLSPALLREFLLGAALTT
jgi:hypothetical protein